MRYRRVVEIGSGSEAGPFFDHAEKHIIVDREAELVESDFNLTLGLTPVVADARRMPEIPDASADIVIARNVIGDQHLGTDFEHETDPEELRIRTLSDEAIVPYIDKRRQEIIGEAARILQVGGPFVIVEQYTPDVADAYFGRISDTPPAPLTPFGEVALSDIVPDNYALFHDQEGTRTWVSYKQ